MNGHTIVLKHGYLLLNCLVQQYIKIENYEQCQVIENIFCDFEKYMGKPIGSIINRDSSNAKEKYLNSFFDKEYRENILGNEMLTAAIAVNKYIRNEST